MNTERAGAVTVEVLTAMSIRKYRETVEQRAEDVALMMCQLGVQWTRNTVTAIELRKRKVSMGELMLLLSAVPVSARDFLHDDRISSVHLAGDAHMSLDSFISLVEPLQDDHLRQEIVPTKAIPTVDPIEFVQSLLESGKSFNSLVDELTDERRSILTGLLTDAERRAALRFNVSPEIVLLASHALWGEGLEQVRDRRDGPRSVAHKGHRTRELYEALATAIQRGELAAVR